MGVGEDFREFCENLTIQNRQTISARYKRITRRLNLDFWDSDSSTDHSLYVGSYGRGTAIGGFSDLDMIFRLPFEYYRRYDDYQSNGQAALLQDVRRSLRQTYSNTRIGADGQVVVINFDDGVMFEVVPAFNNTDGSFTYPDSNDGGRWMVTNPRPEIAAVAATDAACNSNLKRLCRMMRAWSDTWNPPMGGLLVDTLADRFLRDWEYRDKSFLYYDYLSRDFFHYMSEEAEQSYWRALGSGQYIWSGGKFQYKAKRCYKIATDAIAYQDNGHDWSARQKWREIYGTAFPQ